MRAVIVATGLSGDVSFPGDRLAPMLWLADRPFVQHVCETLVRHGVTAIDWVLGPRAAEIASCIGDGTRFGVPCRYHAAGAVSRVYETLRAVLKADNSDESILLGHADRLVDVMPDEAGESAEQSSVVLYGTWSKDGPCASREWAWSGWAALYGRAVRQLPAWVADEGSLGRHLATGAPGGCSWTEIPDALDVRTFGAYLDANRAALEGRDSVRVPGCASVHPTATLIPPVAFGGRVEIAAGAVVGPNVAVGSNCVIDRGAVLSNAVVLPGTYVGERLHLDGVVVDRDRVIGLGADGVAVAVTGWPVASLTSHLPARVAASVGSWVGRGVKTAARLGGVRTALRRLLSEEWKAPEQPTGTPEPVPVWVTSD